MKKFKRLYTNGSSVTHGWPLCHSRYFDSYGEFYGIKPWKVVGGEEKQVLINKKNLSDFLGVAKYKFGELEPENRVGIVTGLAWTEYGGEILKIETVTMPGKGKMQITGKLGDVMQESVKAAKSFVRSKCLEYGIIPPLFEKKDFHIHVPEGATPKDGPSAGIGMVTSIVSSIKKPFDA